METYLIGYYPLYLYSNKVHIIPESLNMGIFPPLHLVNESASAPYLLFMGSNMNIDSKYNYFQLHETEILKNVPELFYSFITTFDLLFSKYFDTNLSKKRFNLMHFYLIGIDANSGAKTILNKVSIDLIISSVSKKDPSPSFYFVTLKLRVTFCSLNQAPKTFTVSITSTNFEKTGKADEVISYPSWYETKQTKELDLQGLVSAQIFIFQVNQFFPLIKGQDKQKNK